MELKEAAVSSLVDYLYTGHLSLPSNICRLLELATAAHCFQLQVSYHYYPLLLGAAGYRR